MEIAVSSVGTGVDGYAGCIDIHKRITATVAVSKAGEGTRRHRVCEGVIASVSRWRATTCQRRRRSIRFADMQQVHAMKNRMR